MARDCESYKELLSAYVDGELEDELKRALEEHITQCEQCERELKRIKLLIEAVKNLPCPQAPSDFLLKLRARISTEPAPYLSRWQGAMRWLSAHPAYLGVMMAMIFLGAFILGRYTPEIHFSTKSNEFEPAVAWEMERPAPSSGFYPVSMVEQGASPVMTVSYSALKPTPRFVWAHLQTPTQLVIALVKHCFDEQEAEIIPIKQGAVVITSKKVFRITISDADFVRALRKIGPKTTFPTSLKEAQKLFSLKIEKFPNPLAPER